jgi:hypothetical protein
MDNMNPRSIVVVHFYLLVFLFRTLFVFLNGCIKSNNRLINSYLLPNYTWKFHVSLHCWCLKQVDNALLLLLGHICIGAKLQVLMFNGLPKSTDPILKGQGEKLFLVPLNFFPSTTVNTKKYIFKSHLKINKQFQIIC